MENEIIKFSYNWNNKLDNKAFTTIRLHNPRKYAPGRAFEVQLNGEHKGTAILQERRIIRLEQLNDFACYLDTGYSKWEMVEMILKRMYKHVNLETALFDFCLLVYEKPKKKVPQVQTSLEFCGETMQG